MDVRGEWMDGGLDLGGHGDSTWSTEGHYNPTALRDDLESLIVELDLYVRPVVLVGFG